MFAPEVAAGVSKLFASRVSELEALIGHQQPEGLPVTKKQIASGVVFALHRWGEFPRADPAYLSLRRAWNSLPLEHVLVGEAIALLQNRIVNSTLDSTHSDLTLAFNEWVLSDLVLMVAKKKPKSDAFWSAVERHAMESSHIAAIATGSTTQPQSTLTKTTPLWILSSGSSKSGSANNSSASASAGAGFSRPWWGSGLALRLRAEASLNWSEALGNLPPPRADELVLSRLMHPSSSRDIVPSLTICAPHLKPFSPEVAAIQLPQLILQLITLASLGDEERAALMMCLSSIIQSIEPRRQDPTIAAKIALLAESYSKSAALDVKESAILLAGVTLAASGDHAPPSDKASLEKLIARRISKPLSAPGSDGRKAGFALSLAATLVRLQPSIAAPIVSECFERRSGRTKGFLDATPTTETLDEDLLAAKFVAQICDLSPSMASSRLVPSLLWMDPTTASASTALPSITSSSNSEAPTKRLLVGLLAINLLMQASQSNSVESPGTRIIPPLVASALPTILEVLSRDDTMVHAAGGQTPSAAPSASSSFSAGTSSASTVMMNTIGNLVISTGSSAELNSAYWELRARMLIVHSERLHPSATSSNAKSWSSQIDNLHPPLDTKSRARLLCICEGLVCLSHLSTYVSASMMEMASSLYPSPRYLSLKQHPIVRKACLTSMCSIVSRIQAPNIHKWIVVDSVTKAVVESVSLFDELCNLVQSIQLSETDEQSGLKASKCLDALEGLALAMSTIGLDGESLALACERLRQGSLVSMASMMREERNIAVLAVKLSKVRAEAARSATSVLHQWWELSRSADFKPTNYPPNFAWSTTSRGVSVVLAMSHLDANSAFVVATMKMLDSCWDKAQKLIVQCHGAGGGNETAREHALFLADVGGSGGHHPELMGNVLKRLISWRNASSRADSSLASSATSSSSQPFKGFMRLRTSLAGGVGAHTNSVGASNADATFIQQDDDPNELARLIIHARTLVGLLRFGGSGTVTQALDSLEGVSSESIKSTRLVFAYLFSSRHKLSESSVLLQVYIKDVLESVILFCRAIQAWTLNWGGSSAETSLEMADHAWLRAERRAAWIWLRKCAASTHANVDEACTELLKIGPISLGSTLDETHLASEGSIGEFLTLKSPTWTFSNDLVAWLIISHWSSLHGVFLMHAWNHVSLNRSVFYGVIKCVALAVRYTRETSKVFPKIDAEFESFTICSMLVALTMAESVRDEDMFLTALSCSLAGVESIPDSGDAAYVEMIRFVGGADTRRVDRLAGFCARARKDLCTSNAEKLVQASCFTLSEAFIQYADPSPACLEAMWLHRGCPTALFSKFPRIDEVFEYLLGQALVDEVRASAVLTEALAWRADGYEHVDSLLRAVHSDAAGQFTTRRVAADALACRLSEILGEAERRGKILATFSILATSAATVPAFYKLRYAILQWAICRCGKVEDDESHESQREEDSCERFVDRVVACLSGTKTEFDGFLLRSWCEGSLASMNGSSSDARTKVACAGLYAKLRGFGSPLNAEVQEDSAGEEDYDCENVDEEIKTIVLGLEGDFASASACLLALVKAKQSRRLEFVNDAAVEAELSAVLDGVIPLVCSALMELWRSETSTNDEFMSSLQTVAVEALSGASGASRFRDGEFAIDLFWSCYERRARRVISGKTALPSDGSLATLLSMLDAERRFWEQEADSLENPLEAFLTLGQDGSSLTRGSSALSRCGETARLILLSVAQEVGNTEWMKWTLDAGGAHVAREAFSLLCRGGAGQDPGLLAAAARASERFRPHDAPVQSRYRSTMDDQSALDRALQSWKATVLSLEPTPGSDEAAAFERAPFEEEEEDDDIVAPSITRRGKPKARRPSRRSSRVRSFGWLDERSFLLGAQEDFSMFITKRSNARPQPNTTLLEDETFLRPFVSPVAEALSRPETRNRLAAHASDLGLDPAWIRFWELRDCDRPDLAQKSLDWVERRVWPTFERSRWWLSVEESPL